MGVLIIAPEVYKILTLSDGGVLIFYKIDKNRVIERTRSVNNINTRYRSALGTGQEGLRRKDSRGDRHREKMDETIIHRDAEE
jgi:hypothetical protein